MKQELPTGSGEWQLAHLVEHHEAEPAELGSDGASLDDSDCLQVVAREIVIVLYCCKQGSKSGTSSMVRLEYRAFASMRARCELMSVHVIHSPSL